MKKIYMGIIITIASITGCAITPAVNPYFTQVRCNNGVAEYGGDKQIRTGNQIIENAILKVSKEDASSTYYIHPDAPFLIQEVYGGADNKHVVWSKVFILDEGRKHPRDYNITVKSVYDANITAYNTICKKTTPPEKSIERIANAQAGSKAGVLRELAYLPPSDKNSMPVGGANGGERKYDREPGYIAILTKHIPGFSKPSKFVEMVSDPAAAMSAFLTNPEKKAALDADLAAYFTDTTDSRIKIAALDKRLSELKTKLATVDAGMRKIDAQDAENKKRKFNAISIGYGDLYEDYQKINAEIKAVYAEKEALK